jgi:hypothetical protein
MADSDGVPVDEPFADPARPGLFEDPVIALAAAEDFVPILSYGMGVESTAILLRWMEEPDTLEVDVAELIVVVSMTGDEWTNTRVDVERYILPRLRYHKVRLVQVARAGHLQRDGIVVLDDSREPERLHADGAYKLSDELRAAGTVPSFTGEHRCSLKFKSWVIESWLEQNVFDSIRHTFGYNADELSRVTKSDKAIARVTFGFNSDEEARVRKGQAFDRPYRIGHYPLVEWGWDRQDCLAYIKEVTGADWQKSACVYCPFARVDAGVIARQKQFPDQIAEAMVLERISLAMNPRGRLYKKEPLYQIVSNSGNVAAMDCFRARLQSLPWGLYRVRRIYQPKAVYDGKGKSRTLVGHDGTKKGTAHRCVEKTGEFKNAAEALRHLHHLTEQRGLLVHVLHELSYANVSQCGETYPTTEEYYVAAPALVETKARNGVDSFDESWSDVADLYCGLDDLPPLFSSR